MKSHVKTLADKDPVDRLNYLLKFKDHFLGKWPFYYDIVVRHIQYAYSISKGKRPHQVERNPKTPINQNLYNQILNDYIPPLAVYIITDTSLPTTALIPQSCHAALLFYKYNGPLKDLWAERDRTIVVLGTSDMDATIKKLKEDGHYPTIWTEDDYGNKITSIVIGPVIKAEAQEYFKDYKLLK